MEVERIDENIGVLKRMEALYTLPLLEGRQFYLHVWYKDISPEERNLSEQVINSIRPGMRAM